MSYKDFGKIMGKKCKRFEICNNLVGEGRRAEYCLTCSNTRQRWNIKCQEWMMKNYADYQRQYRAKIKQNSL